MNAHNFLSFVQNEYDFERANAILSEINLKNCWKHWLTAELVHIYNKTSNQSQTATDVYYPALKKNDDEGPVYLRYQADKKIETVTEKRVASRADFSVLSGGNEHYFEIRCANKQAFIKNKDLSKVSADMQRIEAIKKAHPALDITVIFAFYGAFSNKEIETLTPLDNSNRCTYVLDCGLTGSGSISRLCQMQRSGEPRLCLAAYSAK